MLPVYQQKIKFLRQQLEQQTGPFTVVHLGDIAGNKGLKKEPEAQTTARIDQLIALVQGLPNGRIYFVPGDKVLMNFPGANHDPDVFEDPDTFIIAVG